MKFNGSDPRRLEIKPETDDEKVALQKVLDDLRSSRDSGTSVYWGDSDHFKATVFIMNSYAADTTPQLDVESSITV